MSILSWVIRSPGNSQLGPGNFVWSILLNWTFVGMISGAIFAITLSVAERRKGSLDALSMRRVAGWGAIGGVALPMLLS